MAAKGQSLGQWARFSTASYNQERRSMLRFVAGQAAVAGMLKSPGSQWTGDFTAIFDANP